MNKTTVKRLVLLAVFVVFIFLFRFLNLGNYFSLEVVRQNMERLQTFVAQRYALSLVVYMFLYVAVMAFSIPVASVMTLTGGFLFGTVVGAVVADFGATVGCVISFLIVRYALGDPMRKKYGDRLATFNKELDTYGHFYLLSSRLIIVFPPFLINILAGLAHVRLVPFAWTTFVGMLPGAFVYAFAGTQLRTITSVRDVLSFNVVLAITLLLAISLIPVAVRVFRGMRQR